MPHRFIFAGRELVARPEGALFWPARRALLVADLHLEKASWFARRGQMLPPFDSRATLERLLALADACSALEIWALGDSFHDGDGPDRLPADALGLIGRIARGRRMIWIAGNHDAAARLPGERRDEAEVDGLVLRHEAAAAEARPEISGHYHPKLRLRGAGRALSRPCFATGGNRLILPAFGALTGGLDVTNAALRRLLGQDATALVALRERLLRFALPDTAAPIARHG